MPWRRMALGAKVAGKANHREGNLVCTTVVQTACLQYRRVVTSTLLSSAQPIGGGMR